VFGHVYRTPDERMVKKGMRMEIHGNKIIRKTQKYVGE
jgi:hypothetical protein